MENDKSKVLSPFDVSKEDQDKLLKNLIFLMDSPEGRAPLSRKIFEDNNDFIKSIHNNRQLRDAINNERKSGKVSDEQANLALDLISKTNISKFATLVLNFDDMTTCERVINTLSE